MSNGFTDRFGNSLVEESETGLQVWMKGSTRRFSIWDPDFDTEGGKGKSVKFSLRSLEAARDYIDLYEGDLSEGLEPADEFYDEGPKEGKDRRFGEVAGEYMYLGGKGEFQVWIGLGGKYQISLRTRMPKFSASCSRENDAFPIGL